MNDKISPADVAAHVEALCAELAVMSRHARMPDVAVLLEGAQHAARRWLQDEKAAPEDAA
ncbi:MAG: hypothetical protein QM759_04465 [Terricaulis sp.]